MEVGPFIGSQFLESVKPGLSLWSSLIQMQLRRPIFYTVQNHHLKKCDRNLFKTDLGGGFKYKYVLFTPLLGEMIQF